MTPGTSSTRSPGAPGPPPASADASPIDTVSTECLHCGSAMERGADSQFCCEGCRAVYGLLQSQGLGRYYGLGGADGTPVNATRADSRDFKWLEAQEQRVAAAASSVRVDLDVQGLHCAACVWLLGELFRRQSGGQRIDVNPALGRAELVVTQEFPLRQYVREVEQFGYLFGPRLKAGGEVSNTLLARIGVCAAIALNAMIFSLPLYLGLASGRVHTLFRLLAFVLTTASIAVGGSVFIASAWRAARRRVLHLDLPVALGIVFAFSGSVWAFAVGRDRAAYFDTLAVFITLMLVGRWLQERVLERNRRYLLASDGIDGLLTRRVVRDGVELIACRAIEGGDTLLIAPADVIPVDSVLDDATANCSLDWISGESAPRSFARGEVVPAGAFNVGAAAITVRASSAFESSALVSLLQAPRSIGEDSARATTWWQRLAGRYVIGVVLLAIAGFVFWFANTGDPLRAIEVATAVLVVTCPCAFGIATPMAYELVYAGLRRAGLFVRSSSFLDRATSVRRLVFDKTGTLTTGQLRLVDDGAVDALAARERDALYNMVVRSTHPKSMAIRRAFDDKAVRFVAGLEVIERGGHGLELMFEGHVFRLGSVAWAAADSADQRADVVFTMDTRTVASFVITESLRPDARAEIASLAARGYEIWILSGDAPSRVAAMAAILDVPAERAIGGASPVEKADWLAKHDNRDTLMIGDGINDALAVERAFCSGTPAIDRPFMPARTDFYVVAPGLRPIGLALRAAAALGAVHRRNLCAALAYNAAAVALALGGKMSPLLCAVLMPTSSLVILFATIASLSKRSPLWRSSSCKSS